MRDLCGRPADCRGEEGTRKGEVIADAAEGDENEKLLLTV